MVTQEGKTLAIINHILGIFTGFIGPLIIYLVAKDQFAKDNAREALNWQLSLLMYGVVSAILILLLIGILFLMTLYLLNIVFSIIAAVRANEDKVWKYPLTLPFIKN